MWKFRKLKEDDREDEPIQDEFFSSNKDLNKSQALVREVVQNSMDASDGDGPVLVRFSFHDADSGKKAEYSRYFEQLPEHLQAVGILPEEADLSTPGHLVIEDFGTTGLNGSISDRDEGNFYRFWHCAGVSSKGAGARGRWGLGKTVFSSSSTIRTFFGLTHRADDGERYLMGQAFLGNYKLNEHFYKPYSDYSCNPEDLRRPSPYSDEATVEHFSSHFNLSRNNEPGLSIVVPFPDPEISAVELCIATIEHYFFPILRNDLAVEIDGLQIDESTIHSIAAEFGTGHNKDVFHVVEFGEMALTHPLHQYHNVDYPERIDWKIDEGVFTPEHLDRMRSEYNAGMVLAVRVPVAIQEIDGEPEMSFYDLFLKSAPQLPHGHDRYIRKGLAIIGHHTFKNRKALGILLAEHEPVENFLGDAEDPAHIHWNEKTKRFQGKYQEPRKRLSRIKNSLAQLLDLLTSVHDESDEEALLDIFYVEKERSHNAQEHTDVPPNIPPVATQQPFRISKLQGGFCVRSTPEITNLPEKVFIEVAYMTRKGNSFRRYSQHDFMLENEPLSCEWKGAACCTPAGNRVEVNGPGDGFELSVTGFDPNRDIRIRTMLEDQ